MRTIAAIQLWLCVCKHGLEKYILHRYHIVADRPKAPSSSHALDLLVGLGKRLEPEVKRQGLTEERLVEDVRKARKEIFKEVYTKRKAA